MQTLRVKTASSLQVPEHLRTDKLQILMMKFGSRPDESDLQISVP